jgi:hypothetical protein
MEVNIADISTSIRAADASTLLTPQVLERIVAVVAQRVHEDQKREQRIRAERSLDHAQDDQEGRAHR